MNTPMRPQYDIYMVCPVAKATEEEIKKIREYKDQREQEGKRVLFPVDDTDQHDPTGGVRISQEHVFEILNSKEIHIYWNPASRGSYVDVGTSFVNTFAFRKPVKLMNRKTVEDIVEQQEKSGQVKSYERVLLHLDDLAKKT